MRHATYYFKVFGVLCSIIMRRISILQGLLRVVFLYSFCFIFDIGAGRLHFVVQFLMAVDNKCLIEYIFVVFNLQKVNYFLSVLRV